MATSASAERPDSAGLSLLERALPHTSVLIETEELRHKRAVSSLNNVPSRSVNKISWFYVGNDEIEEALSSGTAGLGAFNFPDCVNLSIRLGITDTT